MLVMTAPTSSSRFLLLPEAIRGEDAENRPKVRRYQLARVGASGAEGARPEAFGHLRHMHD